ncbi:hypothetical protein [Kangiella taiwanensis]|uniref:Uncharacterized protein n=1 Tax=Kangiella taiwanensis TaxID=1079179 RepID=A0ABP8I0M6_9GAMM|nr:hypothetical protein [Kangiella taiwanensis]
MNMPIVLTITSLLIASALDANNYERDALTIDKSVNQDLEFQFPNDNSVYPEISDFEVVNYVTMSNEYGERKVTITLHNTSTGNRIFVSDQVMALYANGERVTPYQEKVSFKGKETQTLTLTFNSSKYPILKVYTRN